ncbi:MAG: gluconate 2-dehydrogenase subunit 3 family protein [Chitinophagaceae bacterium]
MNRRLAIQKIVILSAGSALLPACMQSDATTKLALKKLQVSLAQQDLLAALTQMIIPSSTTPGAKEMRSHEFVLKMMDDCASPEDQQKFMSGLNQFEELAHKKYGEKFSAVDKPGQKELLQYLEDKKNSSENAAKFYRNVKGLTLQNYTTSEYYMTNVMKYNIIPKTYKGCVAVNIL